MTLFNRVDINMSSVNKPLSGLWFVGLFVDALNCIGYVDSNGIRVAANNKDASKRIVAKTCHNNPSRDCNCIAISSEYEVDQLTTES
jgi:hypothetical protein